MSDIKTIIYVVFCAWASQGSGNGTVQKAFYDKELAKQYLEQEKQAPENQYVDLYLDECELVCK
jgi:hypothetical protein